MHSLYLEIGEVSGAETFTGQSLSLDSSLNRTPRENCYISGYEGPNEIYEYFLEIAQNIISLVQISDPKD